MHYTIGALLTGNDKILEYYAHAKEHWQELLGDEKETDADAWAEWIATESTGFFEKECGGHFLGHEIMAWSAFGALYSTQFGWQPDEQAKAEKLVKAFEASACGDDVKAAAKKAADSYEVGKAHAESTSG